MGLGSPPIHYCTTSFNKAGPQVLRRFKSCSRCVEDSRWWGSLTMVPPGNKAKRFLPVNHTTKTIHHHHHHLHHHHHHHHHHKNKCINKIKNTNIGRARHFRNIFGFIDDLTSHNDCGEFERDFHKIYLSDLTLKKENFCLSRGIISRFYDHCKRQKYLYKIAR